MGSSRHKPQFSGGNQLPSAKSTEVQSTLYDALDQFSEALAVVETVSNSLQATDTGCPVIGAEIATLRQGVAALRSAHERFDLAIPGVTS